MKVRLILLSAALTVLVGAAVAGPAYLVARQLASWGHGLALLAKDLLG